MRLVRQTVTEYVMTENDKRFINDIDIYIRDNMGDPDTTVELNEFPPLHLALYNYINVWCRSRVPLLPSI